MTDLCEAEELAAGALEWLLATAKEVGPGLGWARTPSGDEADPTFYQGTAGVVLALMEGREHFGDDRYGDAAVQGARWLGSMVEEWSSSSLYTGLTGIAFTLRAVHDVLGDNESGVHAARALELVRERFNGPGWDKWFELMLGNAGIAVGALKLADTELALMAAEPYLSAGFPTPHGQAWNRYTDSPALFHHVSHGTLGIAYALAAVGHATNRPDLLKAALAGVADVVSRNEAGPDGFLVPHSDPQRFPDRIARYNYGWCQGPTGDAQVFRLLAQITRDPSWESLVDQCWATVTGSGIPQRRDPGFWDNNGRCCGTAGVLSLACDRMVERDDGGEFAGTLVADLAARAITDTTGSRWSNHEHRADPSDLEPQTGWAHGNAGIIPELLRYARITTGLAPTYAVPLPDHPEAQRNNRNQS